MGATTPTTVPVEGTTAGSETPSSNEVAAAPMPVTVDISDFAFVASDVRVAVGGTVTWTNSDSQQHTATGTGTFDTGAIKPGESKSVTFDTAGAFPYVCSYHPFMKGTVTVG
jgi:plastocyanin